MIADPIESGNEGKRKKDSREKRQQRYYLDVRGNSAVCLKTLVSPVKKKKEEELQKGQNDCVTFS